MIRPYINSTVPELEAIFQSDGNEHAKLVALKEDRAPKNLFEI